MDKGAYHPLLTAVVAEEPPAGAPDDLPSRFRLDPVRHPPCSPIPQQEVRRAW